METNKQVIQQLKTFMKMGNFESIKGGLYIIYSQQSYIILFFTLLLFIFGIYRWWRTQKHTEYITKGAFKLGAKGKPVTIIVGNNQILLNQPSQKVKKTPKKTKRKSK